MSKKILIWRLLPIWAYKRAVWARFLRIEQKKKERFERLAQAFAEMNQWYDIPLSQQYGSLCKILKINNNQSAKHFIMSLNIGDPDLHEEAKKLPLI